MGDASKTWVPQGGMRSLSMDVTRTCREPMAAGIPRIVRGLYRELRTRFSVVPVQWVEWPGRYSFVKSGSPEGARLSSDRAPGRGFRVIEGWTRRALAGRVGRDAFAPGTAWLIPEPFRERRAAFWVRHRDAASRRVAIFYDATPLAVGSGASARRRGRYADYLMALDAFDCVVAISGESRDDLVAFWNRHGQAGTTVRVEPLPCDFASLPRQASPAFDAMRILVVSTLDAHKNHARFLAACDILWNEGLSFSVDLVGRPSGDTGRRIGAAIASRAAAGRAAAWRAQVGETELVDSYRRCSFTVYPSLREGFGLPILESLWHGRPCICGANGALGETAAGGGCLTVDQTDPVHLANAMRTLLTDRAAYMRMHGEAMRRAFRTWHDYADAMASVLADATTTS